MYGYQGRQGVGWEELGDWGWHINTIDTMYKIDNRWEHCIAGETLLKALW